MAASPRAQCPALIGRGINSSTLPAAFVSPAGFIDVTESARLGHRPASGAAAAVHIGGGLPESRELARVSGLLEGTHHRRQQPTDRVTSASSSPMLQKLRWLEHPVARE